MKVFLRFLIIFSSENPSERRKASTVRNALRLMSFQHKNFSKDFFSCCAGASFVSRTFTLVCKFKSIFNEFGIFLLFSANSFCPPVMSSDVIEAFLIDVMQSTRVRFQSDTPFLLSSKVIVRFCFQVFREGIFTDNSNR